MTDDPSAFMNNLQTVAQLCKKPLNRLLVNERSDTTQLLGCFEQTSQDLSQFLEELVIAFQDTHTQQVLSLKHKMSNTKDTREQYACLEAFINSNQDASHFHHKLTKLKKTLEKGKSSFEWVDSVLI